MQTPHKGKPKFLKGLFRRLSFMKTLRVSDEKQETLNSVRTAVTEMKQVKAGKLNGRPVQALLNKL